MPIQESFLSYFDRPDFDNVLGQLDDVERAVAEDAIAHARLYEAAARELPDNLEQIVEHLLTLERGGRRRLNAQLERSRKMLGGLHRQSPTYRTTFGVLLQREVDAIERWLEQYRDLRWRLMALRAEKMPSKPVGPVRGRPTNIKALAGG
jgi:hypothetical protein